MTFWFWERMSPDQRARQWLDWLDEGDLTAIVSDLKKHPETLKKTAIPLLHVSILAGKRKLIQAFLQHGANPNQPDRYGVFALILALEQEQAAELIPVLLAHGANPDQQDTFGATPLMYAAQRGHTATMAQLIGAGWISVIRRGIRLCCTLQKPIRALLWAFSWKWELIHPFGISTD